jgi:putative FmdB family regulatory protein
MPIYEYYCHGCHKEIGIWYGSIAQAMAQTPVCADCGGEQLTRLISNVAVARSAPVAHASSGQAPAGGSHTSERPQELAQAMRAASAGRDVGKDFQEVASRLEKGESATSVEASLRKRVGEKMQPH